MTMYRQGDVLIQKINTIPKKATKQSRKKGERVILAEGEATGHAHAIANPDARMFLFDADGDPKHYLKLPKKAWLRHEEHNPIELPAGDYRIIRQREYTPERIRQVVD